MRGRKRYSRERERDFEIVTLKGEQREIKSDS